VSTDDPEIAAAARELDVSVVHRPPELAADAASSESAVLHAIEALESSGWDIPPITLLVQCTSPFLLPADIDLVVGTMESEQADTCLTVSRTHGFLWQRDQSGSTVAINHNPARRLPRQQLEPQFLETGAVYGFRTVAFRHHQNRFFGRVALAEVDPRRTVEIDEPVDLVVAESLAAQLEVLPHTTQAYAPQTRAGRGRALADATADAPMPVLLPVGAQSLRSKVAQ